jgi:hypothetical protein
MAMLGLGVAHFIEPISGFVWILFFIGMVLLPLLALLLFMQLGKVSDIFIYQREQRHALYALGVLFSVLTAVFIFNENALSAMIWSLCNMAVLVCLTIINFMGYKASAHMAGVSGLLAWALCLSAGIGVVVLTCLLLILVYMARKGLSAHSHFELILGFCLGLFVTFALAWFLLNHYGLTCSFV